MANDVSNIRIEPVDLTWGNPETTKITAVADSTDSLDGTFVAMTSATGVLHHVWYNTSGGGAPDPAPANSTPIEIAITTDDSAAAVATATITGIDGVALFNAKVDPDDSASYIVQNVGIGAATDTADGSAPTSFTILKLREGSSFELGFIDGDIDFSPTEDLFDVTAQQAGTQILDKIRTGNNVEPVAVAMKESVAAKLKVILEAGGASVTPGGGTEVTGWGETKRFLNISTDNRQLIMHPIRNISTDRSEDLAIWRAYPNLTGLNFSGESDRLINVEFQVIPDPLVLATLNMFIFGDHQQNLLK